MVYLFVLNIFFWLRGKTFVDFVHPALWYLRGEFFTVYQTKNCPPKMLEGKLFTVTFYTLRNSVNLGKINYTVKGYLTM